MFTTEAIWNELNALDFVCDDEEVLAEIAADATDIISSDSYLIEQVMDAIDQAIFNKNLPRIDD